MEDLKKELLELKEKALKATQENDADFYRNYLSDDAVAVVPYGVFNKETIVQQMASADSSFKSIGIEDTKVIVLNEECGMVTYKAIFQSRDQQQSRWSVFVTTVYAKREGFWKGVFYQQTPTHG